MNDEDREAFVSYMRENMPFSYYQSYQCQELSTWQSACEYKQKEIDELKEQIKNIRKDAVIYCIKKLRDLQNKYRHQSIWNHSNDPKFAPVELSDYLFINVLREIDDL